MLTILGKPNRTGSQFCDGHSRRGFLKIGGMAMGGLSLAQAMQSEAATRSGRSHKAIINIYMPGGPSHIDLWDLKPDAPVEVRGEFRPIDTNVPGIQICELFPRMAQMIDKFIPIRTMADADGGHDAYQCMTGRKRGDRKPPGDWPQGGAWVSKLQGPVNQAVPANVGLMYTTGHRPWGELGTGGYLGLSHSPFNMLGKEARSSAENMVLHGITLERLRNRTELVSALDSFHRAADASGVMDGMDVYTQQAMGILTTSKLADALDLSKEDPKVLERYGKSDEKFQRDGAPRMIENFCIARRLVEAGARFVSMNYSRWDWHGGDGMNFPMSRDEFPLLDQGMSALVSDLHERGLDRDVSVVLWGEFGRTPRINKNNSRDHWPQVSCAMLAGGGMRTGQVIGETNRLAEHPIKRPVKFQEVFATLYRNVGLDIGKVRIFDNSGVPRYLVDEGIEPLHEVIQQLRAVLMTAEDATLPKRKPRGKPQFSLRTLLFVVFSLAVICALFLQFPRFSAFALLMPLLALIPLSVAAAARSAAVAIGLVRFDWRSGTSPATRSRVARMVEGPLCFLGLCQPRTTPSLISGFVVAFICSVTVIGLWPILREVGVIISVFSDLPGPQRWNYVMHSVTESFAESEYWLRLWHWELWSLSRWWLLFGVLLGVWLLLSGMSTSLRTESWSRSLTRLMLFSPWLIVLELTFMIGAWIAVRHVVPEPATGFVVGIFKWELWHWDCWLDRTWLIRGALPTLLAGYAFFHSVCQWRSLIALAAAAALIPVALTLSVACTVAFQNGLPL